MLHTEAAIRGCSIENGVLRNLVHIHGTLIIKSSLDVKLIVLALSEISSGVTHDEVTFSVEMLSLHHA